MRTPICPNPLSERELIDLYFIEHRTKILDIAAFLDRLDRAVELNARDDYRMRAFRAALSALSGPPGERMLAVQIIFSDPTTAPRPALDQKSANGAYDDSDTCAAQASPLRQAV